jgi:hypothetical protein
MGFIGGWIVAALLGAGAKRVERFNRFVPEGISSH